MFRCDTDSEWLPKVMNMSYSIILCFTFIILLVTLYLILDNRLNTLLEDSELLDHEIATDLMYNLKDVVKKTLPIMIGSILIGVVLAVFLQEWVSGESWTYRIFDWIIAILAGIPSVLYGLLCVYYFVFKSGRVSYLTQSLTVMLLAMPITIQYTQNAVKSVDVSVREAVYALGVKKLRAITDHVLPYAFSGIMSGVFTAVSRTYVVTGLIFATFAWTSHAEHSDTTFSLPIDASVYLIAALLCSLCSSLLKKHSVDKDYVA